MNNNILVIGRNENLLRAQNGFIYFLKKMGWNLVETVNPNELSHGAHNNSVCDLVIILGEYHFLVDEVISLPDGHKPIIYYDLFEEERKLQNAVSFLKDVYLLSGFVTIDKKLDLIMSIFDLDTIKVT